MKNYFSDHPVKRLACTIISVAMLFSLFVGVQVPTSAALEHLELARVTRELPEFSSFVSEQKVEELGHVSRLSKYDLNTDCVGYLNADGTETAYLFQEDIKFADAKGVMHEKDTTIVPASKRGFAYAQAANNFQTYFPASSLQAGVLVEMEGYSVSLSLAEPPEKDIAAAVRDGYIQYNHAFGEDAHLRYTPGMSSVKEDIVLDRFTGQTDFSFILDAGGLTPSAAGAGFVLLDDAGEPVFDMPGIVIYDSAPLDDEKSQRFSYNGEMVLKEIEGGRYLLTVRADKAFLTDENTVYPVFVDPTLSWSSSCNASADACVYSRFPANNFGSTLTHTVGYTASHWDGYLYTKFDLSAISSVRYDDILAAFFSVCDTSDAFPPSTFVEAYMVSGSWNESTITWNNRHFKICSSIE